jgi:hypothetical protein
LAKGIAHQDRSSLQIAFPNGGSASGMAVRLGVRQGAAGHMYLAYVRDPDGNKLVGVYRMPAL